MVRIIIFKNKNQSVLVRSYPNTVKFQIVCRNIEFGIRFTFLYLFKSVIDKILTVIFFLVPFFQIIIRMQSYFDYDIYNIKCIFLWIIRVSSYIRFFISYDYSIFWIKYLRCICSALILTDTNGQIVQSFINGSSFKPAKQLI